MNDIATGTIIGRLGRDAELKFTAAGGAICTFAVATNHSVKQDGQWVDEATWWRGTLWGKQAEAVSQYLTKGKQIAVSGEIFLETWTGKEGDKRQTLCINASSVQLLGSKEGHQDEREGSRAPQPAQAPQRQAAAPSTRPTRNPDDATQGTFDSDEIPF